MRRLMKSLCWLIFLAFIGLSSFANWEHGTTSISSFMLAVVPVGFAASIFILEGIVAVGKATKWTYLGIIFVAAAAGIASYLGLYGMARDSGIPIVQSALLPLAFDGVVAVASMGIRAFSSHEGSVSVDEVLDRWMTTGDQYSPSEPLDMESLHEWAAEISAPVSPAPSLKVETSPDVVESVSLSPHSARASRRASWDVSRVADMALAGEPFSVAKETGIGQSTYSNITRVAKLLRENPRRDLSAAGKLPSGDVISLMRQRLVKA
jgi:hypothetical protein